MKLYVIKPDGTKQVMTLEKGKMLSLKAGNGIKYQLVDDGVSAKVLKFPAKKVGEDLIIMDGASDSSGVVIKEYFSDSKGMDLIFNETSALGTDTGSIMVGNSVDPVFYGAAPVDSSLMSGAGTLGATSIGSGAAWIVGGLAAVTVGAVASHSGGSSSSTIAAPTAYTGLVQDDYISGAKVFVDTDNNGVLDWTDTNNDGIWEQGEGEQWAITDAHGGFTFYNVPVGAHIVATGGVDITSGALNGTIVYKAIDTAGLVAGVDIILSPLSTLIATIAQSLAGGNAVNSANVSQAADQVAAVLNLGSGADLLSKNPVVEAQNGDATLLAAAREIVATLSNLASLVTGASITADSTAISSTSFTALASLIETKYDIDTPTLLDLTNSIDLEEIVSSVLRKANEDGWTSDLGVGNSADLAIIANAIFNANSKINFATMDDDAFDDFAKAAMYTASVTLGTTFVLLGESAKNNDMSDNDGYHTQDISTALLLGGSGLGDIERYADETEYDNEVEDKETEIINSEGATSITLDNIFGYANQLASFTAQFPASLSASDYVLIGNIPEDVTLYNVLTRHEIDVEDGVARIPVSQIGYLKFESEFPVSTDLDVVVYIGSVTYAGTVYFDIADKPMFDDMNHAFDSATPTLTGYFHDDFGLAENQTLAIYDGTTYLGDATVNYEGEFPVWSFIIPVDVNLDTSVQHNFQAVIQEGELSFPPVSYAMEYTAPSSENVDVIVTADGAYIDFNHDGVLDGDDTDSYDDFVYADFAEGGNADLVANQVVVTVQDFNSNRMDLTGFGSDDKLVFNMRDLIDNGRVATTTRFAVGSSEAGWAITTLANDGQIRYYSGQMTFLGSTFAVINDAETNPLANFYSAFGVDDTIGTIGNPGVDYSRAVAHITSSDYLLYFNMNNVTHTTNTNTSTSELPYMRVFVTRNGMFSTTSGNDAWITTDGGGEYVDFNGRGNDPITTIDFVNNHVELVFLDVPDFTLSLDGYGEDDRIYIDRNAMIVNDNNSGDIIAFDLYTSSSRNKLSYLYEGSQSRGNNSALDYLFNQTSVSYFGESVRMSGGELVLAGGHFFNGNNRGTGGTGGDEYRFVLATYNSENVSTTGNIEYIDYDNNNPYIASYEYIPVSENSTLLNGDQIVLHFEKNGYTNQTQTCPVFVNPDHFNLNAFGEGATIVAVDANVQGYSNTWIITVGSNIATLPVGINLNYAAHDEANVFVNSENYYFVNPFGWNGAAIENVGTADFPTAIDASIVPTATYVTYAFDGEGYNFFEDANQNGINESNERTAVDPFDFSNDSYVLSINTFGNLQWMLNLNNFGVDDKIQVNLDAHDIRTLDFAKTNNNYTGFAEGFIGTQGNPFNLANITAIERRHGSDYSSMGAYGYEQTRSGRQWTQSFWFTENGNDSFTLQWWLRTSQEYSNGEASSNTWTNAFINTLRLNTCDIPFRSLNDDSGNFMARIDFVHLGDDAAIALDNLPYEINLVVDTNGIWFDLNNDGVIDASDDYNGNGAYQAFVSYSDVNNRNVHFNEQAVHITFASNTVSSAVDLTGFGADDKLSFDPSVFQFDSVALNTFGSEGHHIDFYKSQASSSIHIYNDLDSKHRGNVFRTDSESRTAYRMDYDGGGTANTLAYWRDDANYLNRTSKVLPEAIPYTLATHDVTTVNGSHSNNIRVTHWTHLMYSYGWETSHPPRTTGFGTHTANPYAANNQALFVDGSTAGSVDFVLGAGGGSPVSSAQVLVTAEGIYLDSNSNGVLDEADVATNLHDGVLDLTTSAATIIFQNYDFSNGPVDLNGFGTDDKIEFDMAALKENHMILDEKAAYIGYNTWTRSSMSGSSVYISMSGAYTDTEVNAIKIINWSTNHSIYLYNGYLSTTWKLATWTTGSDYIHLANKSGYASMANDLSAGSYSDRVVANANHGYLLQNVDLINVKENRIDLIYMANADYSDASMLIDENHDGQITDKDMINGAYVEAVFSGASQNINLANDSVTIKVESLKNITYTYPEIPMTRGSVSFDLNGFGSDDKVVFDLSSFKQAGLDGNTRLSAINQPFAEQTVTSNNGVLLHFGPSNSAMAFGFADGKLIARSTWGLNGVNHMTFTIGTNVNITQPYRGSTTNDISPSYEGQIVHMVDFVPADGYQNYVVIDSDGNWYFDVNNNAKFDFGTDNSNGTGDSQYASADYSVLDTVMQSSSVHLTIQSVNSTGLMLDHFGLDDKISIDMGALAAQYYYNRATSGVHSSQYTTNTVSVDYAKYLDVDFNRLMAVNGLHINNSDFYAMTTMTTFQDSNALQYRNGEYLSSTNSSNQYYMNLVQGFDHSSGNFVIDFPDGQVTLAHYSVNKTNVASVVHGADFLSRVDFINVTSADVNGPELSWILEHDSQGGVSHSPYYLIDGTNDPVIGTISQEDYLSDGHMWYAASYVSGVDTELDIRFDELMVLNDATKIHLVNVNNAADIYTFDNTLVHAKNGLSDILQLDLSGFANLPQSVSGDTFALQFEAGAITDLYGNGAFTLDPSGTYDPYHQTMVLHTMMT